MTFLQHFLPGQPLEENGQTSAGMMVFANFDRGDHSFISGFDVEWSDSYLKETQDGPTEGSPLSELFLPDFLKTSSSVEAAATVTPFVSSISCAEMCFDDRKTERRRRPSPASFFSRLRLRCERRSTGESLRTMAYFFLPSLRRMYSPA
jgi:hypothetical protein